MLRDISLAVALFAFAGVAAADCSDSHGAKRAITDDQAQATQAPVKKAALTPSKKNVAACEGNCADKSAKVKDTAQGSVALARSRARGRQARELTPARGLRGARFVRAFSFAGLRDSLTIVPGVSRSGEANLLLTLYYRVYL